MAGVIDPASLADAGTLLARILRLDPAAVVRLRPAGDGTVALWARLPFEVLVCRGLRGSVPADLTVPAGALVEALRAGVPVSTAQDTEWRWPLPRVPGRLVERLPAADVARVSAAAADTIRTVTEEGLGGRAVGARVVRDALLDHVPIVVTTDDGERVPVPQRLIQALARMAFLGDDPVEVRVAGPWVGLAATYGTAWHRPPLRLTPR